MNPKLNLSPERQAYLKQVRRRKIAVLTTQLFILVAVFVLWEISAKMHWIDPFITSQPSRMITTLKNLHYDGHLYLHLGITIWETFIGFAVGTLGGILIAIMLWWSDFLNKVSEPYLVVLNALPKVALGPIIIVWLGNGQPAIIAMALLISIVVTIISLLNGFLTVDQDKIKLLKTFGANKYQILCKVILPASLPNIIAALKVNVGLSWVGVIMGEFLVSKAGLGYLIVYGSQVFKLDLVMTSVTVLIVAAAVMYLAVAYLEKKLLKWQ
ncbi:binding-protein-dependent transport systems inner membrane component [Desulforamulus reducens MI-1]|uniref:Binding-protein-dependent transport systems inner membrane component n=1 Tax=Desulforamulus reducens (strain ATCC BAA-1160 / DSM 100696 / MI-1) TaxID=349161 RepID=A4J5K6_DESRM|nr:ABC transporter permease [Desulforamulus reducens]ABO50359.1 binding-protein-dependent transport systems inner membrane component [Desulforamulus reducens MI-1]